MRLLSCVLLFGCAGSTVASGLPVDRVVLYQNGVGYFERRGAHSGGALPLRFAAHEVDDVLETLTVLAGDGEGATTIELPTRCADDAPECRSTLLVDAPESDELAVAYAVTVPQWQAAYRVVVDDAEARLQVWALVHNASDEPWNHVDLRLATAAPFSFASSISRPQRVSRPDASGHFRASPTFGVITGTRTRGMSDGPDDLCPDEPEDYDGFEDEDGCPEPDNDHDGILDGEDECPSDPEAYNGLDDTDGCPDRGRVVIESSSIQILDRIYFAAESAEIGERSRPILEAIASTLLGNPQIERVRVEGHAAGNEPHGWALSAERAGAVRAALIAHGVDAARLEVVAFGASRTLGADAERDRRTEFQIEETRESAEPSVGPARLGIQGDIESASGAVVYRAPGRVSVRAGATALVAVLDRTLVGGDVLLYRPDSNVPGSERHPMRAARLEAPEDVRLVPGPVAVFARDRFAGEGVLGSIEPGQRTLIPYRLDAGVRVEVQREDESEPRRILGLERGVVTLETTAVHTTRYRIEPGPRPAPQIFVHHVRAAQTEIRGELPPGSELGEGAVVAALPLRADRASTFRIEETRAVRREVDLLADLRTAIDVYLQGSRLPDAEREALGRILRLRVSLRDLDDELGALRRQLGDAASRSAEIRRNLSVLEQRGDEATRRRLRASLRDAVGRTESIAHELDVRGVRRIELREALIAELAGLRIPPLAE